MSLRLIGDKIIIAIHMHFFCDIHVQKIEFPSVQSIGRDAKDILMTSLKMMRGNRAHSDVVMSS